jgi:hypothetical protein
MTWFAPLMHMRHSMQAPTPIRGATSRATGTHLRPSGRGAIASNGPVNITNSTFAGNSAALGGADLQVDDRLFRYPTVTVFSSIFGSSGGANCSVSDTCTFLDNG